MISILMPILPKHCELIASGKKTIEVRKTRPKLETPFKVYIYCTKSTDRLLYFSCNDKVLRTTKSKYIHSIERTCKIFSGKVIGEFVCDKIDNFDSAWSEYAYAVAPTGSIMPMHEEKALEIMQEQGCLSLDNIITYFGDEDYNAYFWHISDLVIYDKPKELSEFRKSCNHYCEKCGCLDIAEMGAYEHTFTVSACTNILTRPPQSWCYIEE